MAYEYTIEGIEKHQKRNEARIKALKPEGEAGEAVKDAVQQLHKYAVSITHVGKYEGGGALKASHRMEVDGLEGMVFIDPKAVSPRGRPKRKNRPVVYGVYENARMGDHGFYDRTVDEIGPRVLAQTEKRMKAALYVE